VKTQPGNSEKRVGVEEKNLVGRRGGGSSREEKTTHQPRKGKRIRKKKEYREKKLLLETKKEPKSRQKERLLEKNGRSHKCRPLGGRGNNWRSSRKGGNVTRKGLIGRSKGKPRWERAGGENSRRNA